MSPQQLWCLGPGQYVLVHCHAACRIILTSKWFSAAPCSQPPLSVYSHSPPYMLPGAIHGVSGIFTVRREPYRPTVYLRDPATRGCPAEKGITSPARVLFSLRLSTRCQRTAQHMPNGGRNLSLYTRLMRSLQPVRMSHGAVGYHSVLSALLSAAVTVSSLISCTLNAVLIAQCMA